MVYTEIPENFKLEFGRFLSEWNRNEIRIKRRQGGEVLRWCTIPQMKKWRFWIDRGGTFTDIIGVPPRGALRVEKRPSCERDGGLAAAREMLELPPGAPIPAARVEEIRVGTTIATNALLERRGEKTAVAVTRGFADALQIGDQTRPNLFSLHNSRPPPLWERAVEIDERIGADGKIVRPLNENDSAAKMRALAAEGFRALAIALMHGFSRPRHEKQLAAIARAAGIPLVVCAHDAAPFGKFIPRAHTAAVDAYLHTAIRRFVRELRAQCEPGIRLLFMQSDGTPAEEKMWRASRAVMSGPAGGAIGSRRLAKIARARVVGFDMGGTSTDVSLDCAEVQMENRVAGASFFAPMLDIHTVAAGGGSIVRVVDGRLLSGPQSAGAAPGPACYGNGGPATITDCNVVLGKLRADFFPAIFGAKQNRPLDESAAAKKVAALSSRGVSSFSAAEGFIRVAVEQMAAAARRISVGRGINPAECVINSFGGAAGQHICMVADSVGARRAMISRYAPALSAWGIGAAPFGEVARQSAECALSSPRLLRTIRAMEKKISRASLQTKIRRRIFCRYAGVDSFVPVPWRESPQMMEAAFHRRHKNLFGYCDRARPIVAAIVELESVSPSSLPPPPKNHNRGAPAAVAIHPVVFAGRRRRTPFYRWTEIAEGATIAGPAVVADKWNTAVIDPGWRAVLHSGNLMMERITERALPKTGGRADAAMLEIFHRRFAVVAEQMGEMLRRTAMSVNIRERLDFSCALFDKRGGLIANAPHIPVHLGSMGDSVLHLIKQNPPGIARGDVFMLNSPYHGGTHLPDITVIKGGRLDGKTGAPDYFIAARGHHSDVGGVSAGSMPAASTHIDEEGVLIELCAAVSRGRLREKEIVAMLCGAKYPARAPHQNIADLRAQIAALETGAAEMRRAAADFGAENVCAYMRHVQNNAARACRRLLSRLSSGEAETVFDDGAKIRVAVRINRKTGKAVFDFGGTSPAHARNFNAPKSVVYASVIYCLRVLLGEDMPLNDGIMRPIKLVIPAGGMLNPRPPAAVAAGNVEVSQNIADAVFAAFGACAHSQGTCNNFTLGFRGGGQYYETVCGGLGASPNAAGADAMQAHMTNSRASDPEVLENAHPLRLETFAFRKGSGGAGKYSGGAGAVRRIRFLQDGEATILSSRRKVSPKGMRGGGDGKTGRNAILKKNGKVCELSGCANVQMRAGDIFIMETPGGGGWGNPPRTKKS